MNRPWIVAAAVFIVLGVAVVALVLRRGGSSPEQGPASVAARVFTNDSLGVRMRLPDSPSWTFERAATPRQDGVVVIAKHTDGNATVRLVALPATPQTTVDGVFEARKKQMAQVFGVQDLSKVLARTVHDEKKDIGGRAFRQWQAFSQPIEVPGEPPASVVFMWLVTATPKTSLECLGMLRFHVPPSPEEQKSGDAQLADMAYILQSFEVR